jgi:hypothetical protein
VISRRWTATFCMLALSALGPACKKNKVALQPPVATPAPTAPKPPKTRQSAANPPPTPTQAVPVQSAPQPRLGEMLSPAEESRYNSLIDQSLGNVRGNLASIGSRSLNREQQTAVQQIQNFVQQAQDTRKVDLPAAKGLADKAEVLSRDLARSVR